MLLSLLLSTTIDSLPVSVYASNDEMGQAAAADAITFLQQTISDRRRANIILAAANSQLTFLEALRSSHIIEWNRVNVFHMDEYLNLHPGHPASFPRFLHRHFLDYLQPSVKAFFPVPVQNAAAEDSKFCREYEELLRAHPADLCVLGFGENGHLAFNDPPFADFHDPDWVKIVRLDEVSRRQQVGEGHFPDLSSVPTHAVTLTIPALLSARKVLALVPEARKAIAVERALRGPVDESCPGSVLRRTTHAHLYLDRDSAALAFPGLSLSSELQG